MASTLLAWIGNRDLEASEGKPQAGLGPIANAAVALGFDEIDLLSDHASARGNGYVAWLRGRAEARVQLHEANLTSPVAYAEIYRHARALALAVSDRHKGRAELTFHLSPGTPAMTAVWIILGKTQFRARLIDSSKEHGVREAEIPFDLSAEFVPDLLRHADEALARRAAGTAPLGASFASIIHQSESMRRLLARAERAAVYSVPVLIEGESGTGKELLANAIHQASPRAQGPFLAVNCGAIPENLVEAQLFGYARGAFTGAEKDGRKGLFESADGGTVFLDEVGELRRDVQVRLLRVLQQQEIVRVGEHKPVRVNVRIISATHRSLLREVAEDRFREDLFYRLAVLRLEVPPLRERQGDLGLLIRRILADINREARERGQQEKELSPAARNVLLQHSWPGNVRELQGTLTRAFVWSNGSAIDADDARGALLVDLRRGEGEILNRPLGDGFDLKELLSGIARHYLKRAMQETAGNKTQAAGLVGFKSYQTLTKWLERHGVQ